MTITIKLIGPETWGDALLGAVIVASWVALLYGLYGAALLWRGWQRRRRLSFLRLRRRIHQTWPLPRLDSE